ncbi:hypothetical protein ANN_16766 [Periplaneta americana]|uniref:HTH psq-type domain-containing protein n=1 Tax=Periplaneta americana TaxID=6978 RepID=A0ABQ8ST70_PERAM|nr:hypothetical protein ANN_16766 [Periplaneta americana]
MMTQNICMEISYYVLRNDSFGNTVLNPLRLFNVEAECATSQRFRGLDYYSDAELFSRLITSRCVTASRPDIRTNVQPRRRKRKKIMSYRKTAESQKLERSKARSKTSLRRAKAKTEGKKRKLVVIGLGAFCFLCGCVRSVESKSCVEFLAFWLDVQNFHVCVDVSVGVVGICDVFCICGVLRCNFVGSLAYAFHLKLNEKLYVCHAELSLKIPTLTMLHTDCITMPNFGKIKYTKDQLTSAVPAVRDGERIKTSAKKFGVLRSTLQRYIKGQDKSTFGPKSVLSGDEEEENSEEFCVLFRLYEVSAKKKEKYFERKGTPVEPEEITVDSMKVVTDKERDQPEDNEEIIERQLSSQSSG